MTSFDPKMQSGWPFGESEMAILIRNYDWSETSLGQTAGWPQSLRTVVDICLSYPLPCAVVTGPDRLLMYNDLCAHLQGDAHPGALAKPAALAFPEALSDVGPIHERLLSGEPQMFCKRPWVFSTARHSDHGALRRRLHARSERGR